LNTAFLANPEIWISLFTLTILKIVLGIDNIVSISILSGKLPAHQQKKSRIVGLALAMVTMVLMLLSLNWVMSLTTPIFNISQWIKVTKEPPLEKMAISGRDLILIIGGLFLIYKSTSEIHNKLEGEEEEASVKKFIPFLE
jgi:predicted tellurium resistance membrane protein TerC